jgi:hypothetical protein
MDIKEALPQARFMIDIMITSDTLNSIAIPLFLYAKSLLENAITWKHGLNWRNEKHSRGMYGNKIHS